MRNVIRTIGLVVVMAWVSYSQSMMGLMAAKGSAGAAGIAAADTGNSLCVLGTSGVATIGPFTSTGNFFFVYASGHPASLPLSIADNKGNTANYHLLTPTSAITAPNGQGWYLRNATIGSGHTITVTGAGGLLVSACVETFSGVATTGTVDQESHTAGQTGTGCSAGAITPGANNSLIVVGLNYEITVSVTSIGSGFTVSGSHDGSAAVAYGVAVGYLAPQVTAASVNPAWLVSPTSTKDCSISSFQ